MSNRILLIIDPQIDFITGSLSVPGAEKAMNKLAEYIKQKGNTYKKIIATADYHPIDHISFEVNGGKWPSHCIADSVGAAIWPSIMDSFLLYAHKIKILHKGDKTNQEEYSIFKNEESAQKLQNIINQEEIDTIDICGLAGDICVADTINDGLSLIENVKFNVLKEFTPSLDGGIVLNSIIEKQNLSCNLL